jgi:hypothetical protein
MMEGGGMPAQITITDRLCKHRFPILDPAIESSGAAARHGEGVDGRALECRDRPASAWRTARHGLAFHARSDQLAKDDGLRYKQ